MMGWDLRNSLIAMLESNQFVSERDILTANAIYNEREWECDNNGRNSIDIGA